ncbi:IS4 family transposase [Anaerobacillus isosaccharinicus]|uniref:IS4 family transposase n=1 Tax=Anaerobacillus isosaccharinicus TaxID=1532552 RepID=A0A1S2L318_9BACI|nr:IS4 family transposase [Anaerobacillus isosaccharinicus]MBA5584425.1 IS4 family transposase [Anaerobacillus isosaccharinicus]MBA5584930.1 IS4 family transposase [Anaerobacillus isosaccharinicus]MBA5585176.1 IS4 family transposase [Anaerobacillus isosaccharinicus]MBA5587951.1 IS4 family transposase [Anaerobacillus isosaccharinicus]MBA5588295.1 IS4 family transposase [Anaerobacillus isosaccharinicus]
MDKITRKTSFGQWFSPINLELFDDQVKTLKLDFYTKKLTTESFLKLLLYAQLEEVESLHALSDCLFDDQLQKGVNLDSISISQLSRRLNGMNPDLFQRLFLDLVSKIHAKTHYTKLIMPLKIIDSSTLPLNLTNHKWAKFRKTKAGVKLHLRLVFMEKGISYPEKAVITTAKEHDRGQLEIMVDDRECMYVFDRGYLDYERFDRMTDEGYFFLSRLRKNAVIREVYEFKLPESSAVLSDQMILIGTPQKRAENYFRLLKVIDSKGNELHLITNRFDLSAEEISEMYKSRWAIELFFKWIKQHLSIKKFYGQSEWAIHNQVFIALIVFCLHVLAQHETKSKRKTLQISRYLKAALWKPAHIWLRKIEGKAVP